MTEEKRTETPRPVSKETRLTPEEVAGRFARKMGSLGIAWNPDLDAHIADLVASVRVDVDTEHVLTELRQRRPTPLHVQADAAQAAHHFMTQWDLLPLPNACAIESDLEAMLACAADEGACRESARDCGGCVALQAQLDDVTEALGADRLAAADGYHGTAVRAMMIRESATAERLEISRRAHQADRERLAAMQRQIGPLRGAARAVVRECSDGGTDNAVLARLIAEDLVDALGDAAPCARVDTSRGPDQPLWKKETD